MRKLLLLVLFAVVALACRTTTPTLPPTADMGTVVAQTLMAYTAEAAMTLVAAPTETSLPPEPDTPVPPQATHTPPPTQEENAPDPLPASHTGVILNNGECFNFDDGQVTAPDSQCDVWLAEPALLRQLNGAQLSGYVTLTPPTRSHCAAGRYEPGDLAVQTDLYMCFISNQGQIGFMVARSYRGGVPFTGIVFDYWVFH